MLQVADPAHDPEAAAAHGESLAHLDQALAALPLELGECLVLREMEELSYKEIGHITGVPIGTVMSRLWRARQALMHRHAGGRADMTSDGCAEMRLMVQADVDGELTPAEAARVSVHVDGCADCTSLQAQLSALSGRIRRDAPYHRAPDSLLAAIQSRIADAAPRPAPGAVMPARSERPAIRWWKRLPRPTWCGSAPFGAGFALAALVYQRRQHVIDLFVWPDGRRLEPGPAKRDHSGYNVVRWSRNGMAFWAVSDLNAQELSDFVRLWRSD